MYDGMVEEYHINPMFIWDSDQIPIMRTGVLCFHFAPLTGKRKRKGPQRSCVTRSKTRAIQGACLKVVDVRPSYGNFIWGRYGKIIVDPRIGFSHVFPLILQVQTHMLAIARIFSAIRITVALPDE